MPASPSQAESREFVPLARSPTAPRGAPRAAEAPSQVEREHAHGPRLGLDPADLHRICARRGAFLPAREAELEAVPARGERHPLVDPPIRIGQRRDRTPGDVGEGFTALGERLDELRIVELYEILVLRVWNPSSNPAFTSAPVAIASARRAPTGSPSRDSSARRQASRSSGDSSRTRSARAHLHRRLLTAAPGRAAIPFRAPPRSAGPRPAPCRGSPTTARGRGQARGRPRRTSPAPSGPSTGITTCSWEGRSSSNVTATGNLAPRRRSAAASRTSPARTTRYARRRYRICVAKASPEVTCTVPPGHSGRASTWW